LPETACNTRGAPDGPASGSGRGAKPQEMLEFCLEEHGELRPQPPKFIGMQQIEVA
jgi:hypothetical protein